MLFGKGWIGPGTRASHQARLGTVNFLKTTDVDQLPVQHQRFFEAPEISVRAGGQASTGADLGQAQHRGFLRPFDTIE